MKKIYYLNFIISHATLDEKMSELYMPFYVCNLFLSRVELCTCTLAYEVVSLAETKWRLI